MKLRPYQERGIAEIDAAFAAGARRVLAVAPTGAGKGTMAAHMIWDAVQRGQRCVFVVHRREIVKDIATRIRSEFGVSVGTIVSGQPRRVSAPVQVASVQTLLGMKEPPPCELLILDEAHHYVAEEWTAAFAMFPGARATGFTATPQRADGKGMGDAFDALAIVAQPSELLASGHIMPCDVMRPEKPLGIDMAMTPLQAYEAYAMGTPALIYERTVSSAQAVGEEFDRAGHRAVVITDDTSTKVRDAAIAEFKAGTLNILINVYVLTEGVDLPRAEAIILGRPCEHASTYVQIVGRALRPYPGKLRALLLDLTGASYLHGMPTEDRAYALTGSGMTGSGEGEHHGGGPIRIGRVLGLDLKPAKAAEIEVNAPQDPKIVLWANLLRSVHEKRRSMRSAIGAFRYEFGEAPPGVAKMKGKRGAFEAATSDR